jgi:hypothetical protein
MKVSQRENPRFSNLRLSTEEVALISEHSAISFQLRRGREVICLYGCSKCRFSVCYRSAWHGLAPSSDMALSVSLSPRSPCVVQSTPRPSLGC